MLYGIYPVEFLSVIQIFFAVWAGQWCDFCFPAYIPERCAAQWAVHHTLVQYPEAHSRHTGNKHHNKAQYHQNTIRIYSKIEKHKNSHEAEEGFYKIASFLCLVFQYFGAFFIFCHNIHPTGCFNIF